MNNINKKCLGSIVSISLLVVISVLAVVGFQTWTETYNSKLFSQNEVKTNDYIFKSTIIEGIVGKTLFVKGDGNELISKIEVNDKDCDINLSLSKGINKLDISSCLNEVIGDVANVVVYTDKKIIEKKVYLDKHFICPVSGKDFHGGEGTLVSPYQICNCEMLQKMKSYSSSYFELITDVNCIETKSWNNGSGFIPIGNFRNYFEGNNLTIRNLYINLPSSNYVGLFSSIYNSKIKDINLVDFNIVGNNYVGGLVGSFKDSDLKMIENINIENINLIGSNFVGGLVGITDLGCFGSKFLKISVSGNINGDNYVGGIVGYVD